MRKVRSESWLSRMGLGGGGRKKHADRATADKATVAAVGVLAFEVASLMTKAVQLWRSLADDQIAKLRGDVFRLDGVRKLVSDDEDFLLALAVAEMMDSLCSIARSVARLGKRCSDPLLRRFDVAFADLLKNHQDPCGFQYAGRKMDRKAKKMEKLVAATSNLYQELEVLAELEQGLRRMAANQGLPAQQQGGHSSTDFKHKVLWQRQEVKYLREASLWNRTYDYVVRLLARSLFSIAGRIKHVFGFQHMADASEPPPNLPNPTKRPPAGRLSRSHSVAGPLMQSSVHPSLDGNAVRLYASGPLVGNGTRSVSLAVSNGGSDSTQCLPLPLPRSFGLPPTGKRQNSKTKWPVAGGPFGGCIVAGNEPPFMKSCVPLDAAGGSRRSNAMPRVLGGAEHTDKESNCVNSRTSVSLSMFESRYKLLNAPASTLGAAALALHYANIIITIEKLVTSPHLIGPDARDDLYGMLTTSIRASLRARLKSYAKNLASSVYDPVLATEWSEALTRILEWLAPLAHNMVRWQSERNFEQQHLVSTGNVLLLQTLYFANQTKTEAAITELLVGLNYLWRFGREVTAKAMQECMSSSSSRSFQCILDSEPVD